MSHAIIDTNVAKVANGRSESPHASLACVKACQRLLATFAADQQVLVIDNGRLILREYMQNLRSAGQPGAGDAFLKWVLTNQANPQRCVQVAITVAADAQSAYDFAEFPDDPALERFDRSDRTFVAVARTHPEHPPIHNAVDTDWHDHQQALAAHGVVVIAVCPDDLAALVAARPR
jgi:hypothetical protein